MTAEESEALGRVAKRAAQVLPASGSQSATGSGSAPVADAEKGAHDEADAKSAKNRDSLSPSGPSADSEAASMAALKAGPEAKESGLANAEASTAEGPSVAAAAVAAGEDVFQERAPPQARRKKKKEK